MSHQRPQIILDTSPLITLCTFKVSKQLVIEHLLPICELVVVETVALEGTANPTHSDAKTINKLLNGKQITRLAVPNTPINSIVDTYQKLGQGERDTIKLGTIMPQAKVVLDDYLAFVIAGRFEVTSTLLLDLLVWLVKEHGLNKTMALEIVNSTAARYSAPFVEHTKYMLGEVKT
jgi:hypothetical protein